jgi:glycosyltransferase involved in cell wall biosynthesis
LKKIIIIVLNGFTNDSRVLKESISLQNVGYDVKVVALHEEPLKEFDVVEKIAVHRIKLKSRNWSKKRFIQLLKYFEFIYRAVKSYKQSDIIHCNDLNALPVGVIIKKFFNKNTKIVYDAHEYEINDRPNESKYSIKIKYFFEKRLIKYADKVITVSNAIAEEYVRLYNIDKPALVLNTPSYIDIVKKNIFREKLGIKKEQTIFLYQGALSRGRGIEILLDTFKDKVLKNSQSVIVFMGYGVLEEMILKNSKEYKNIYFHPAVSPSILLDYTSSADFGISTIEDSCLSYKYCLPNKMFEYLMAEIPVIVSNLPEMKKFVKKNHIGIIVEENTFKGIQEAIMKSILLDRYKIEENIQKVKRIYSWKEQEKVLLTVYRGLE